MPKRAGQIVLAPPARLARRADQRSNIHHTMMATTGGHFQRIRAEVFK